MSAEELQLKEQLDANSSLKKAFKDFVIEISPYIKFASEGLSAWGEGVEKATNGVNNLALGAADNLTSANDYLYKNGFEEWAILFSFFKYGAKYAILTNPSLLIGQGLMSAIDGQDPEKIVSFILETPENLGKFFEVTDKIVESLKESFENTEKDDNNNETKKMRLKDKIAIHRKKQKEYNHKHTTPFDIPKSSLAMHKH